LLGYLACGVFIGIAFAGRVFEDFDCGEPTGGSHDAAAGVGC
jgi:hypothetical protein